MTALIEQTKIGASSAQKTEYMVYYIFGLIEILLGFRLVLKLVGASHASGFVNATYLFSNIFVWPFEGIFRRATTQGIETTAILEPSTIVAIAVYAVVAWGIVRLVRISSGEQQVEA